MSTAEHESLVLRQLAALRRRGLPHDQALQMVHAGLADGPLAQRVSTALRTLAAGSPPDEAAGLDRILANGSAPIATIDHAAQAIDARLSAISALATTRLYLGLFLIGPVLVCSLLAWLIPNPASWFDGSTMAVASGLTQLFKFGGPLLIVGGLAGMSKLTQHIAPGSQGFERAAQLLELAAAGQDPARAVTTPSEQQYLHSRQAQVGHEQAAAEIATELIHQARRDLHLFQHLGPIAGALLALVVLVPLGMLFFLPIFSMSSGHL